MQGRFVWSLMLSLVFLSACGGSGSDSPNEVSEPAIDESFAVDADGRQLALLCYGEGSPTVFLEPGDDGSGDEFTYVMRPLGEQTTTCTYDRPGSGRSDPPSRARRTLDDAAADLHALIEAADLPVPFVHVGASGGGYIALYHASRYADDVAGVALLDVAQDDPKEGAKIFPGAKAWGNQEHLDNVDAMRRVLRLPACSRTVSKLVGHSGVCGRQKRSKRRACRAQASKPGLPPRGLALSNPSKRPNAVQCQKGPGTLRS